MINWNYFKNGAPLILYTKKSLNSIILLAVKLLISDSKMIDKQIIKDLVSSTDSIDFDKSNVQYYDNKHHIIDLFLKKGENVKCDRCFQEMAICGSRKTKMRATTVISDNTYINVHLRTYKCPNGHYSSQENPIKTDGRNISIQKEVSILNELRNKNATYTEVARKYNVSITYVQNLFDSKVDVKKKKLPYIMAVDEIYTKKPSNNHYYFVIYAPRGKKIIDIVSSRRKQDLIDYFSRISKEERDYVHYVSMDLYETYRAVIHQCLPNAKICADPFHVVSNLNLGFQALRKSTMKNYEQLKDEGSNNYWLYKKFYKFLLMDLDKIPSGTIFTTKSGMELDKYKIVDLMLKLNPTLELAYTLKEEYRNFVATATIDTAEAELDNLIEKFKQSNIREYRKFINIMINWHEEIINSFIRINDRKISNGPIERLNTDIGNLLRISFGSTNFKRMRNRVMYALNPDESILGHKKGSNKLVGKKRGKYNKNTNK